MLLLVKTGVSLSTTKEFFLLQDRFPPNSLHESWAFRILSRVKITHQLETSAVHVGICEQNLYANGEDTSSTEIKAQNRMFHLSQKRQLGCYKYSHKGAAGFVAYLRGHISMFNYIKGSFPLILVVLVSHPSSVTVNHGMTWTEINTQDISIKSKCKQKRQIHEA